MAGLNWCWLPFALLFASPLLQLRFALETPAHWWWSFPAQILASFVVDDIWFYAYHRYLHEHPKLYILYHKPHHVFTAPCAWTSHAVHPVEMLLQRCVSGGLGG